MCICFVYLRETKEAHCQPDYTWASSNYNISGESGHHCSGLGTKLSTDYFKLCVLQGQVTWWMW